MIRKKKEESAPIRKKKKRHIKLQTVGGTSRVHLGSKTIQIVVTIPREHLAKRLS
jgi:hypothetical protein